MGIATSNFKWLWSNDISNLRKEMDELLTKMESNLDERRKLNAARMAFDRDMRRFRTSSVHNAEVLEATRRTISHNIEDCWTECRKLMEAHNTTNQVVDLKLKALREDVQSLKDGRRTKHAETEPASPGATAEKKWKKVLHRN